MTEQNRTRAADEAGEQDGSQPNDEIQTGVGREPWVNRVGEGHDGDMGDTGKTDVTPPDANSGESKQPG